MTLDIIGHFSRSEVYAFRNATMVIEQLGGQYRIIKNRHGPCPKELVSWAWVEGHLQAGDVLRIARRKNEEPRDTPTASKSKTNPRRPPYKRT